jgi:phenylalanyl-tRNA synthetase beta chain
VKVSYRWLTRHLPQLPPPEEVAAILVRLGLEVVSLERFGEAWRQVELVELVERRPHPRSSRLWLAVLARGSGERVTVVTGAPAVALGTRADFGGGHQSRRDLAGDVGLRRRAGVCRA